MYIHVIHESIVEQKISSFTWDGVFLLDILLMEEITKNHLGYIKPCTVNSGINYQPQLVSRISEPSTVCNG